MLGMLRLGVGSVTNCIYSKRTKKAEVYNERFPLIPYNYTKCATIALSFYGAARPHAHYGQHNCLLHPCAYSQHFYLAPHFACLHVHKYNINVPLPLSHRQFDV